MNPQYSQVRGELMHEFSVIEYEVRSYLAHFLASQPDRPLKKYKEQFDRLVQFFTPKPITWNPNVLRNPDVHRMDAEITAADGASRCASVC